MHKNDLASYCCFCFCCCRRNHHWNTLPNIWYVFILIYSYEKYERDFWIGYHNNGSGWDWKGDFWTNFTNFAEGYPEYYDCARSSVKGYWKDRNCDQLLPYICKKTSSEFCFVMAKCMPMIMYTLKYFGKAIR